MADRPEWLRTTTVQPAVQDTQLHLRTEAPPDASRMSKGGRDVIAQSDYNRLLRKGNRRRRVSARRW